MRQGELLGLKWSDLDWQRGTLRVQRQVQPKKGVGKVFVPLKTKASNRTIPIGNEMLQSLREHQQRVLIDKAVSGKNWQEQNLIFPSIFGTPISATNMIKEFKAMLTEAGLPKIRFHDLRHTAASIMLNRGIPVLVASRVLGHSQPSTTLNVYGHLIPIMHEDLGNQIDDWVTPVPIVLDDKVSQVIE